MVLRKQERKKSTPSFGSMLDRWNLPFPVRDYQKLGVEFFLSNRAALLADDMGLGKTVQTILAVRLLRSIKPGARILIVTPRSLSRNWLQEFSTWAPDILVRQVEGGANNRRAYYNLPLPVLLATYEQVRIDSDLLNRESRFDVVILDEAQRIKESSSSTSIACRGIPRSRSWALSGTPVENKSDDIIALFSFLDRTLLYKGISRIELHKRIKPHFLRRTKASVASDMPKIINQNLELELGTLQKSAYERTWESRHNIKTKKGRSPTTAHMLALLTKLKQLCNYDPLTGESVKLDALRTILENLTQPGDKILLFSQYVETLKWLGDQLREYPSAIFHGGLDQTYRENTLDWFRKSQGPSLLLMSLKAGGVGLNLKETSVVIMYDRWWNPAMEAQAINRAHRLGRQLPLQVYTFTVVDTIEARIQSLLQEKRHIFSDYVERASSYEPLFAGKSDLCRILNITNY